MKAKFLFGDIVVVEESLIGLILKTWRNIKDSKIHYDVYLPPLWLKMTNLSC